MAAVYKSLSNQKSAQKDEKNADGPRKNKQRVLILSSRGVNQRHRHLLNDLAQMMPHGRKDSKWDSKSKLSGLCELAELHNCNNVLYFEARKNQDLYAWFSKVPNGPTVKMYVQGLNTMEELHFHGNCLKGSRPILSFDAAFDREPYLKVVQELFRHTFGVPQGARRSKPFIDRVMGFTYADGKIWIRNYQITETEPTSADAKDGENGEAGGKKASKSRGKDHKELDVGLVEIGPRVTLTPIIIQEGSFGGPIIYENRMFVSPNQVRADLRRRKASRHNARAEQFVERQARKGDLGLRTQGGVKKPLDELDSRALFA
ncbi:Brix domain-containing protein [Biscogniauxia mediterranea]|nr:Brix domain-containing protein [Biscogniauxia mediterranea]